MATAEQRLAELPVIQLSGDLRVYEARTWSARRDGLAALPDVPDDCGLWIVPCRSIHTIGMRFSLDLVWLDGELGVRGVSHDVAPRRVKGDLLARSVIEVASGRGDDFAASWSAHLRAR